MHRRRLGGSMSTSTTHMHNEDLGGGDVADELDSHSARESARSGARRERAARRNAISPLFRSSSPYPRSVISSSLPPANHSLHSLASASTATMGATSTLASLRRGLSDTQFVHSASTAALGASLTESALREARLLA
eukprot:EC685907.1.p2 GENE.EC685907.1~~EC685907.1.p2  ORF type:complete len:136 (+),score=48.46 EC685907.1:92-499(+)